MRYSKGLILYHDEPGYGLLLKVIMIFVPASLLVLSYYLFSKGEAQGSFVLLAEAFIFGLILFLVSPRGYQVYEDHLRITLGGPLSVKIGFDRIKSIQPGTKVVFGVNYATRVTGTYVTIVPKRGLAINITPKDNNAFIENANRALAEWAKTKTALGRH